MTEWEQQQFQLMEREEKRLRLLEQATAMRSIRNGVPLNQIAIISEQLNDR